MKKTILVVDDTPQNIQLIKTLLEKENYNVKVSTNGKKALDIVRSSQKKPDLILLDIMMPEMDGYEVCKELKKDPNTSNIPIIFVTAKGQSDDETYGLGLGAIDYISKPISTPILLARIKTHLQLHNLLYNLEQTVQEEIQKRETQEKILMQQSKQAAMGEMIDAIAHQWKQPINVINMYIDLLIYDYEDEKISKSYIEEFQNKSFFQIQHMINTLDEFRDFFRPNKKIVEFNLKDNIKKVLLLLQDELIKNAITVTEEIEENLFISGNENEFKHIIINLINNSKDAFHEKNIQDKKIQIKLSVNDENKIITLQDNAGGIPENIIDNIFKPNVTTKKEGTGVGLYLSSQIAQKLGGNLSVKNIEDGVIFTLVI